jgi:hypothetical protein
MWTPRSKMDGAGWEAQTDHRGNSPELDFSPFVLHMTLRIGSGCQFGWSRALECAP